MHENSAAKGPSPLPPLPRTLVDWLRVFGPGAIIASLTIGTGELIFSTRGGALFGYRILFLFVVISILKWGLVVASARHIVLSGVHPLERMMSLPGPRGWLPCVLLLIVAACLPIWVSFHSGVLGNLTSWMTGTSGQFRGGADYLWGGAWLGAVLLLTASGGYSVLERIQLTIVAAMLLCAGVTLILYNPDWLAILWGAIVPQSYAYPEWLGDEYPEIARHSVWVETTRYVGVIGGAGFDYMAYTSFLRDKRWGRAGLGPATPDELAAMAADPGHVVRRWVRAPYVDATLSFVVVVLFSGVFVASGAIVLGPEHKIPDERNLLNLQAQFVTDIHSALLPLYVVGALLTMIGTLYGTLEVACSMVLEIIRSANYRFAATYRRQIKWVTVAWCAVGAYAILFWLFQYQSQGEPGTPRLLLAILTPANLFTGVMGCGLFCLLIPWMDFRFLPRELRMPPWLLGLNVLAGVLFVASGLKGYWDAESRIYALVSLAVLFATGSVLAILARPWLWRSENNRYNSPKTAYILENTHMDILRIVLSVLLPPLGVFLQVGFGMHFWINILLSWLVLPPARSGRRT
jgi:uncharacterized membrane protein YqaE (UPF0057 family)